MGQTSPHKILKNMLSETAFIDFLLTLKKLCKGTGQVKVKVATTIMWYIF